MSEPPLPPKKKGCFFYGCITMLVLFVIAVASVFLGVRHLAHNFFTKFTEEAPVTLPKVTVNPSEWESLQNRLKAFQTAAEQHKSAAPLVLTAADLNAILANEPKLAALHDSVFLAITNDEIHAQVSVPLERFNIPFAKGRYFNAEATLKAGLTNHLLYVNFQTLSTKGVNLPADAVTKMQNVNLANDANRDPRSAEFFSRFDSIEIRDGTVILKTSSTNAPAGAPNF